VAPPPRARAVSGGVVSPLGDDASQGRRAVSAFAGRALTATAAHSSPSLSWSCTERLGSNSHRQSEAWVTRVSHRFSPRPGLESVTLGQGGTSVAAGSVSVRKCTMRWAPG
jgi:hypothetical protein